MIKLTQDIQFDGVTINNFTPIGGGEYYSNGYKVRTFDGTFDGCGYTVSGIEVIEKNNYYTGLFGGIGKGGVVKNVTVKDSSFTGDCVGAIAGISYGTIENCHNRNVYIEGSTVGGITGTTSGDIINCSSAGEIQSRGWAGGITEVWIRSKIAIMDSSGTERNNKALLASEMRTEAFAAQLNANRGSNTDWLEWEIRPEESDYPMHIQRVLYGDANSDGEVDAADALEVLKYVAELIELDENAWKLANVNADEKVDAADALDILKKVAELIDKFEAEK